MKKGIKLLTAWTLSVLMTISTFSVAFADDTASETVSADEVTLAGTMTGNTLTSGNFNPPSSSVGSVTDDGSLVLNAIEFLPYVVFGGKENPATPGGMFAASDKYAISFDVKSPFADDNQKSVFIIADYNSNMRIGYFELYKSQIKFGNNGKDFSGGNVAYSINTNDWVNVKAVIYPKKETADNNRIEWYINENLICVTASNSNNMTSPDRVAKQILVNTPAGLKINNLKLEAVTKKNDINKGDVTEQSTIIGNQNKVHKTVTGIMQARSGKYDIDSEGIYPTTDVDLFLVTEDTLEFYDKYSVSFDVKTKSSGTESDGLLTSVNLLDKNSGYSPGNVSATTPDTYACSLGFFNLHRNKIEFSTNGGTGAALTEYSIRPGEWVNVEYVVSPSNGAAGKTTDFSWYVNGKFVCSGTVADSWEKSKTGILKKFNPTGIDSNSSSGQFWFDNFSINAIDTVKHYDGLLTANASVNNGKLEVVFSKSVANEAVAKNVVITDSENEVITPSSVSLSENKKTMTIDIPGGATAEYYSIQLPERLTDTDSLVISNPTIYTPHLRLTNAQIVKDPSGKFSLKTAYDNTNNKEAEIFAVIAAYDNTTNALICVDVAKYTVRANDVYTPETFPTINVEDSKEATVKAFIWRQTSMVPLCDVIPYDAD